MTEREFATDVVRRLQGAGYEALWAGGCVRDELLGLDPADYDIATSAIPEQVQRLFPRCIGVGASFGVIEVLGPRDSHGEWIKVQVATFRTDGSYSDGRRPDSVQFSTAVEDASRRDFTINGLFYDPLKTQVIDYVGGQDDLRAKVLRAIGNPVERFTEDKLRILRAARMAARFELTIDPATLEAAKAMVAQIAAVSAERIAEELRKILKHPTRFRGAELFDDFGLMQRVLPEVTDPNWRVTMKGLPAASSFELAFAVMLRELPKKGVSKVVKRLKLSNEEQDRIGWLVEQHRELPAVWPRKKSDLFPRMVHPSFGGLLDWFRAEGSHPILVNDCEEILRTVPPEQLNPPPWITGLDLQGLGLKPGPAFKTILESVRADQLDGGLTSREAALERAKKLAAGAA